MIFRNPIYKKQSNVTVKEIGGIVTSMHPSFIGNDRLSDGYNIWNKNGILSSRPGICATENGIISKDVLGNDIKIYYANFTVENINTYNNLCALVKDSGYLGTKIDFFAIDLNGIMHSVANLELKNSGNTEKYDVKNLTFVKSRKISGSGIFVILPVHIINKELNEERNEVQYFELSFDYKSIIKIDPKNFYRPVIIKNGYGNLITAKTRKDFKESRPEGISLLNGLFEARFVLDGESHTFAVPTPILEDCTIEIHLYLTELFHETIIIEAGDFRSQNFLFRGFEIYITVDRARGKFFVRYEGESFPLPRTLDIEQFRVFAASDVSGEAYEIFSSSVSPILFDSRLFIVGGENCGNKVYYSSKTEHLYFCKDYSVSVGNKSYNLTALSMQSKYIIAFKERELYRLSITCTDEIFKEKMETDTKGQFIEKPKCTVTQINDTIGCDLPDTIVTCANRLVWFHSDGVVYTLYGSNLYTEGSIYELSGDISNLLNEIPKDKLKYAFAADFNGYYVLGLNNKLFLMDVRVSGFRYLSNKQNKTASGLAWFLWDAPHNTNFISGFLIGGKEYFIMSSEEGNVIYVACMKGEKDIIPKENGKEERIPEFSLTTAIFDENFDNIDRISFNALIKRPAEFMIFDQNKEFNKYKIYESKEYKSYIVPIPYKKHSVGINIKGSGEFKLKDIVFSFKERM